MIYFFNKLDFKFYLVLNFNKKEFLGNFFFIVQIIIFYFSIDEIQFS